MQKKLRSKSGKMGWVRRDARRFGVPEEQLATMSDQGRRVFRRAMRDGAAGAWKVPPTVIAVFCEAVQALRPPARRRRKPPAGGEV
jgi:hypothetical protein